MRVGERIRGRHALVLGLQASALEQPPHARADRGEQPGDVLVTGRRGRVEVEDARFGLGEDLVEHEGVEMDIEVEAPAEALDDGDAPGVPVPDPTPARLPALDTQQRPRVDAQHGAAEGVVPGEQVA
jgi:hypothetical protein